MKNLTYCLVVLLFLLASKMLAQDSFEERVKRIAFKIEKSTKEEKAALKLEVEAINNQLINGTITREEAERKKKIVAEARAINIESKVAIEQEALRNLVQEKVDGKIKKNDSLKSDRRNTITIHFNNKKNKNDTIKENKSERRTTTQLVVAIGLNNLVTNSKVADSDYKFIGSHFYEWGITCNTRIAKNNNLLHAKYGLSLMYNNLRPTDNRSFVVDGDQTNLEVNAIQLKDTRFRNVYLVAPIHLEFDFSGKSEKDGKTFFQTHKSFRFGVGGYAGINLKSKQITKFEEGNFDTRQKVIGDFNTTNFIYGCSAYVGYKETSLYVKYDLNSIFKANAIKQNNISLGVRWDFN